MDLFSVHASKIYNIRKKSGQKKLTIMPWFARIKGFVSATFKVCFATVDEGL